MNDAHAGRAPATFQQSAHIALRDTQLRHNIGNATRTIRAKRNQVVAELPDWQELRAAGRAIKDRTLRHLDEYLLQFEDEIQRAGGVVHWARDAGEANQTVVDLVSAREASEASRMSSTSMPCSSTM